MFEKNLTVLGGIRISAVVLGTKKKVPRPDSA